MEFEKELIEPSGLGCTTDQLKGFRDYQEDTIILDVSVSDDWKIAAVFDGHGGGQTSMWLEENYLTHIKQYLPVSATIKNQRVIEEGIRAAYTAIDSVLRYQIKDDSGSTAVVGIWNQRLFILINLGDSRGVLFNGDSEILAETKDHKPNNPDEKKRIVAAGGKVTTVGIPRINGQYAVSRSFGDFGCKSKEGELKKSPMSWEPDITFVDLDTISPKSTCYLILASDGVWDEYEKTVKQSHKGAITQTMVTQALVDKAIPLSKSSELENPAASLLDVYHEYNDNATIVWCDILGGPVDIQSIVEESEKFETEEFSDDEGTKEGYLVSGSLISKSTKEMKGVSPEERRQISSWLQDRLKNYIYILKAISINLEVQLTSHHAKIVIVEIYQDPWIEEASADPAFITDSFRDIMRRWKTERNPVVDVHIFTTLWLLSIVAIKGMKTISTLSDKNTLRTPFRIYLRKQREIIIHPYREQLTTDAEILGLSAPELALVIGFKRIDSSLKPLFGITREEQIERIILSLIIISMGVYSFKDKDIVRLMRGDPDPSKISKIKKRYRLEPALVQAVDKTDLLESTTETVMVAHAIVQYRKMKGRNRKYIGNRFIVMSLCAGEQSKLPTKSQIISLPTQARKVKHSEIEDVSLSSEKPKKVPEISSESTEWWETEEIDVDI